MVHVAIGTSGLISELDSEIGFDINELHKIGDLSKAEAEIRAALAPMIDEIANRVMGLVMLKGLRGDDEDDEDI